MFLKLLKYDLIYTFKLIAIYAGLTLIGALLTRITDYNYDNQVPVVLQIMHTIFYNCTFIFAIGLIISTIIRLWARLKTNFYSNESYLTHTLPVTPQTLWNAKFVSSCIAIIFSVMIVAVSFWLAFYSFGIENAMGSFSIIPGNVANHDSISPFLIFFLIALISQLLFIVQAGSAGILAGFLQNNHHIFWSALFGIATYSIGNIIIFLVLAIWSLAHPTISFFTSVTNLDNVLSATEQILFIAGTSYCVLILATYFINRYIIRRGVNID